MNKDLARYLVIVLSFMGILYGTTYQQFRHFDTTDPRGADDALSYLQMAHGNYAVSAVHKHRFVIPALAGAIATPLWRTGHTGDTVDRLAFYAVNYGFSLLTALFLFALLIRLGFSSYLSILGVVMFLTSRITVLETGTPHVDSFYFLSIVMILLLTMTEQSVHLAIALPILALSKETIAPFLFLPILTKIRKSIAYWVSLVIAFGLVYLTRKYIDRLAPPDVSDLGILQHFSGETLKNLRKLATPGGLHDLQNGFSVFLVFAVLGWFLNRKHRLVAIPWYFDLVVLGCLLLAVFNGNLGRMFFAAFPVVIAYALIFIEYVWQRSSPGSSQPAGA